MIRTVSIAAAALLASAPFLASRAADPSTATQTVDAMNALWGRHPGVRANHAKGVVTEGTFTPSADAKTLSIAPLFSGGPIPVTVRFSNSTGLPDIPDGDPDANPHGMAIHFRLPDGTVDIVSNSLAFFPVRTGEEFLELLKAAHASANAPHPTPIEQFFAAHPAAPKAFASATTPTSYATDQYNGVDAFIFVDAAGKRQPFRWRIVPVAGPEHLSAEDSAKRPPDFLATELVQRIKSGPISFRLEAVLAQPGDPTNDPTQPWPADRKAEDMGTITLTTLPADNDAAQKALRLLPNNLTPGIEVSDDPLIDARVRSYVISFGRRVGR